jgi:single-strand DNA-binding protein
MDLNTVALTGRLGSDLELKRTKNDTAVTSANIAVECGFGESKQTIWVGLVFWGKTAEAASKYLGKGKKIAVSGRLSQDEYEDKDGKKVTKTRVTVENWTFAESDKGGNDRQEQSAPSRYTRSDANNDPSNVKSYPPSQDPNNDDIPF